LSIHSDFLEGIHNKKMLIVTLNSKEKGIITRTCVPFDYGPSRKYQDCLPRYHFYDLNSPDGQHNLSIPLEQLIKIEVSTDTFEPSDYISWTTNWLVERDWGDYS
jgi:hypothetical protein